MKEIKHVTVLENQMIAPYMYSMTLQADGIAELAKPGQFVNLYCKGEARLLPRPISICEINKEGNYKPDLRRSRKRNRGI